MTAGESGCGTDPTHAGMTLRQSSSQRKRATAFRGPNALVRPTTSSIEGALGEIRRRLRLASRWADYGWEEGGDRRKVAAGGGAG